MTDYEARYQRNGADQEGSCGGGASPLPREGSPGCLDDNGDSKSQGSREYERVSFRNREKEKNRYKEREKDRDHHRDRERDKDWERRKDRNQEKDRDRHHKDGRGDPARKRSERRDRGRDRDDDYYRSRDFGRQRDYDRDREDRHRRRSRSSGRSEHRSKSRSRYHSRSKRAPPASATLAAGSGAATTVTTVQIPWNNPAAPRASPNMFPLATSQQFGAFPLMPVQFTRHAYRVHVGGISPTANEQSVATFFNWAMARIGGNTAGPGDAVERVYLNRERKCAFVEMRSVEEASNAMALDGIIFEQSPLKVTRPNDYDPMAAATLGPSQPSPNLNLAAVGLTRGSAGVLRVLRR